jgi:glutaconate CoA-transferase subunit A
MTRELDADTAVKDIASGATVGIGGSMNAGHPMALIRALIRARPTGLTITGLTNGLELDFLVAAGMVRALSSAYVGAESVAGLPPSIRWAAETRALDVWPCEEGVHLAALRARAMKQPYTVWTGALGTAVEEHPLVERAFDVPTGLPYLKVRPMQVDVALLWADAADEEGNLLLWGPDFGDDAMRDAADLRIVQVERIVPTSVLTLHPDRVAPWAADVVVRSPLSTHPFAGSSMDADLAWMKTYVNVVTAARKAADRATLDRFIEYWWTNEDGEDAYLRKVGLSRLRELMI